MLDTILTIVGFVAVSGGVAVAVDIAPFALMMSDGLGEDSPAVQSYLVIAAATLPGSPRCGVRCIYNAVAEVCGCSVTLFA